MKRLLSVFLAVVMIAGLLCTGALAEDDHKREPETPGAAVSDMDSDKAAIRVRVNGSWFGTYLDDYKGQTSVWVAVNLDISKQEIGSFIQHDYLLQVSGSTAVAK